MKKFLLFILMTAAILCSCSKENNGNSINVTSVAETDEMQSFTEIPKEYIEQGFSPQVNKKDFGLQLFCYDDNGNIYFSDPADNYCLYVYDGTESKKLTDIKACGLNYYDNKIYFLSPKNEINIESSVYPEGQAFVYDLQSKNTMQIGDSEICDMTVFDGEIYGINYDNDCFIYKYDENDPECRNKKLFNSFVIKKYNDNFITFETANNNDLNFYLQNNAEKYLLLSGDIPLNCFIAFGRFYYFSQNSNELKIIDTDTGEIGSAGFASDFTVLDGELYILKNDMYLYKNGNENKLNETDQFRNIYSDNKNLYGINSRFNAQSQKNDYFFVKFNSDFSAEIISGKGVE